MRHARACSILAPILAACLGSAASAAALRPDISPFLAAGHDFVRPRQEVPDDPLAGIPDEGAASGQRGKGVGKSRSTTCVVEANAADDRDIGDLRAALAFVNYGPRVWPCSGRSAAADLRLLLRIDAEGKILAAEPVAGNTKSAAAMAKKLLGKSITPRAEGATAGVVVVKFASGKV
jgi:hypothetical protein